MIHINDLIRNLQKMQSDYGLDFLPVKEDELKPFIGLNLEQLQSLQWVGDTEFEDEIKELDIEHYYLRGACPTWTGTTYYIRDAGNNVQYELLVIFNCDWSGLQIEEANKTKLV